jgi:hypothetical protein
MASPAEPYRRLFFFGKIDNFLQVRTCGENSEMGVFRHLSWGARWVTPVAQDGRLSLARVWQDLLGQFWPLFESTQSSQFLLGAAPAEK